MILRQVFFVLLKDWLAANEEADDANSISM